MYEEGFEDRDGQNRGGGRQGRSGFGSEQNRARRERVRMGGIEREESRAALEREPGDASRHHALAELEEKKGNSLAAVKEYQRAAELRPSEINLFDWGAELLLHRAYEPASEVFAKGRRLFPGSVRMAMGLGVAAYALGSYELAAQRLCEASDVDPSDEKPYLFLGKLEAVGSGLVPGVVERLERFERLQPGNSWAPYYHALALWKRREGHPEAAAQVERLFKKAVGQDSKLAVAYLQLGILYAEGKDWPKAIAALQSSVKADPGLGRSFSAGERLSDEWPGGKS